MPSVVVDVCTERDAATETALMDAVYGAVCEAFRVPAALRNVILQVHAPHRFAAKPDSPDPRLSTNVSVFVFGGRSLEAKRALYAGIVRRLEGFGIPPACVLVKLHEMPRANAGVRGGQAACDIELGYRVEV